MGFGIKLGPKFGLQLSPYFIRSIKLHMGFAYVYRAKHRQNSGEQWDLVSNPGPKLGAKTRVCFGKSRCKNTCLFLGFVKVCFQARN